jgi:hypothetical protein
MATRLELEKHCPFACVVTLSLAVKNRGVYLGQQLDFIPTFALHILSFIKIMALYTNGNAKYSFFPDTAFDFYLKELINFARSE